MLFKRLVLTNDPLFGSASLEFTPGLTVIYGLNKVTKASRNGNFAGKSYLTSQVPELIWETPVLGTREDRNSVGTRELYLTVRGKDYRFVRTNKKLVVYEGDTPKFKGVKDTKAWISTLPISEADFTGLYYLDSRRPHPLVMGTSSERASYLTRFFNLDKIDVERKLVQSRLSDLKVIKAKLQEVERSIEELRQPTRKITKREIEKLSSKLESYQDRQRKYTTYSRSVEYATDMRPQLRALRDLVDFKNAEQLTKASFKKIRKKLERELKEDSRTLASALKYEHYKARQHIFREATSELSGKELAALSKRDFYENQYFKYRKAKASLPQATDKPVAPIVVKKSTIDTDVLYKQVVDLEHELEHARDFKSGKCPTCGSSVKARKIKVIKAELEPATQDYRKAKNQKTKYQRYLTEQASFESELEKWRQNEKSRKLAAARIAKYAAGAKLFLAIKDIPKKPKSYEGKKLQLSVVQAMVDSAKVKISAVDQLIPNLPLLRALIGEPSKDYSTYIEKISSKLAAMSAERTIYLNYRKQYAQLESRAEIFKKQLSDEPSLQLLAAAYSEKGMKRLAIESVSSMLAAQLNKYSSYVFPDGYKFSVEWNKSKLSILCERPTGKLRITDVRKLSGAENRLFTYLLVFAQLQFVPQQRRSSLMVLDEPTTNMHPETAESFKHALALLQTIIPSIVVITPQSSEAYEDARLLTVVRKNGRSRIVEGHPNTLE